MKQIVLIILLSFIAFSCKKEKVPTSVQKSFYQSNGNFLVLKVGDELEGPMSINCHPPPYRMIRYPYIGILQTQALTG